MPPPRTQSTKDFVTQGLKDGMPEVWFVQVRAFSRNRRKRQCQSPLPPIIESLTRGLKRIVKSTAERRSAFTTQHGFQVLHRYETYALRAAF